MVEALFCKRNQRIQRLQPYYQDLMQSEGVEVFYTVVPDPETAFKSYTNIKQNNSLIDFELLATKNGLNIISLYNEFCNDPVNYYFKNDSHWNINGMRFYLSQIRQLIK